MGKSVGGVTQQTAGSIAVEKEKGTDSIVQYGKVLTMFTASSPRIRHLFRSAAFPPVPL